MVGGEKTKFFTRMRKKAELLHGLNPIGLWLLKVGAPIFFGLALLFVANGVTNGWVNAYQVMVTIDKPADSKVEWLAWFLSFSGWLITPAFAGGVAGYIISRVIDRKSMPLAGIEAEMAMRNQDLGRAPGDQV